MSEKGLIGYTGFVGNHLNEQHQFDCLYNSKNIADIENESFDLLVISGIRAEKWLANKQPEKDWEQIEILLNQLKTVKAKHVVLISTIDVYPTPVNVNEETGIDIEKCHVYGKHRLAAEKALSDQFEKITIIRLPALFGKGLKKNFVYDLVHLEPKFIMSGKFSELLMNSDDKCKLLLNQMYQQDENGNYRLVEVTSKSDIQQLRKYLLHAGFTSMGFTHFASTFQFYNLSYLWKDIQKCLEQDLKLVNITSEPISAELIAKYCCGREFKNKTAALPVAYNVKSIHAGLFDGNLGYCYKKDHILSDLKKYLKEYSE